MKYLIYSLFLISLLNACSSHESVSDSPLPSKNDTIVVLTEAQRKQTTITTTKLNAEHVNPSIRVNGKIDMPPQNIVSIALPLGGYLRQTNLLPGMEVRQGQQIGQIEDEQFVQLQQDYLETKSKLHFATLAVQRQKSLHENMAGSSKALHLSEAEKQQFRIALAGLEEKLRLLHLNPLTINTGNITRRIPLYAPIHGFVTKVNGNVGKYFSPSEVVVEIINPDDVHLNLKVYEKDIPYISVGSNVMAYTNSNSSTKYPANIILIGRDIEPDGSIEVHCHFKNYPQHLAPGTYMNAEIEIANKKSSSLPDECVVSFEGKDYVFIQLKQNTYVWKEVQCGSSENGRIEILHPETLGGKDIVQQGAYMLLMKLKNKEE